MKVLVANGTSTTGAAGFFSTKLSGQGWNTLTAGRHHQPVTTSTVYYATGQQRAALQSPASLGLKPTAVQPLTTVGAGARRPPGPTWWW